MGEGGRRQTWYGGMLASQKATWRLLMIPSCRLSTLSPRAFSVAGPSPLNSLPDSLGDPDLDRDGFRRIYLHCTETFSILEMFQDDTLYKSTYILTEPYPQNTDITIQHHKSADLTAHIRHECTMQIRTGLKNICKNYFF